jgi:hypothetical protein
MFPWIRATRAGCSDPAPQSGSPMTYSKREFQRNYDLSFWVSCSFETALARAVARAQEGLTPAEKVKAYRTIYCPAQEIHLV